MRAMRTTIRDRMTRSTSRRRRQPVRRASSPRSSRGDACPDPASPTAAAIDPAPADGRSSPAASTGRAWTCARPTATSVRLDWTRRARSWSTRGRRSRTRPARPSTGSSSTPRSPGSAGCDLGAGPGRRRGGRRRGSTTRPSSCPSAASCRSAATTVVRIAYAATPADVAWRLVAGCSPRPTASSTPTAGCPWVSRATPFDRPNHGDPFVTPDEPATCASTRHRPTASSSSPRPATASSVSTDGLTQRSRPATCAT